MCVRAFIGTCKSLLLLFLTRRLWAVRSQAPPQASVREGSLLHRCVVLLERSCVLQVLHSTNFCQKEIKSNVNTLMINVSDFRIKKKV